MSSFNQGVPGPATLINSSNCIVLGNTSSGPALTVQQLGAGAVMNVATSTGSSALFVSSTGQVGVGTGSPSATFEAKGFPGYSGYTVLGVISGNITGTLNKDQRLEFLIYDADGSGGGIGASGSSIQSRKLNLGVDYLNLNPSGGNVGIGTTNPVALLQVGSGGLCFTTAQNTNTKTVFDAGVNIINGVGYYSGFLQVQVNYSGSDRTVALLYHYCACKNITGGNMVVNATLLNSAVTASADFNAACTFTPTSGSTFNVLLQTSGTRAGSGTVVYNATLNGIAG